jgi:hypothetical protein
MMRLIPLVVVTSLLLFSGPAFAQEWITYTSRPDMFSVNFPGQPKVQDITYTSELDAKFPARVYTAEEGPSRYSMTVVDYTDSVRIHTERVKTCNKDAHSGCAGTDEDGAQGVGSYKYERRGAPDFAAWKILSRDAKVSYFGWAVIDRIEGRYIHLTNADKSRSFFGIYMHGNRLYITEATVPAGYPEPGLFQQSLRMLDKDGRGVRYETIYTDGFPAPPRAGGGRGGGGGPGGGNAPGN